MKNNEIVTSHLAVEIFGAESQIGMAVEECAELIDSLCKYRRDRVGKLQVITEIADVQIMCEQLAHIFGESTVDEERQRKIERLKGIIEENRNKDEDRSWLYRDESFRRPSAAWNDPDRERYLPEIIPEHFLEGTVAEVEGKKYVAKTNNHGRDYRRVYLQVTDFANFGNTHKYGKLEIDGLHWCEEGGNGFTMSNRLSDIEPRVEGIWEVDLFRIVGEGEMSGSECPVGEATARFVFLDELIATAVYVALLRVDGPFVLDNASSYATARSADDILITVGADGNVEWGKKLKRIFNLN